MNRYRVQWTASAKQDLFEIIQYIAEDDADTALRLLDKIEQKANNLYQYPERGRAVSEFHTIGISIYREIIIRPWRLLYRIADKKVYVMALLDSRRELDKVLLERLINAE